MKVDTKTRGLMEVDERQRITFPRGLFGFESLKEYVLMDAEQEPFYWLQSVDEKQVAFILINPALFRSDYDVNPDAADCAELSLESADKALVFAIVTIPETGPFTANLQGPLLINRDAKTGKQVILSDSRWQTKHDILAELEGRRQSGSGK